MRAISLQPFLMVLLIICCAVLPGLIVPPPAWAVVQMRLVDVGYQDCPPELADGAVTSGTMMKANCFLIVGKVENKSGKTVVDADVFGRIYDANGNPVMQNRTRVGSIEVVPPGLSEFELRISVPAEQPTPLQLEQFKASGFTTKVR
ncbi:hypothetical protein [Synechococcus sp. PCC 6312]|uniref:hypothetical protein n=1 Tax=Synechococcus sp. (strain ATCC 27167 / PCC 6312) TaxID=195253 RepID=UPI00029ED5FB|nr:hypothetical protein [Synechococcus sp. PCC 6312]AFY60167.1 hypothetical protein Syn6312_0966 [Synechococcus sp. PCC 6312]